MKLPRLFEWLLATVLLLSLIWLLFPQQLGVSLYKLSLVSTAGVLGYWLDRSLFPYARPDSFIWYAQVPEPEADEYGLFDSRDKAHPWAYADASVAQIFALSMLRRAVIVGCAMLAMGLGA
jgi:hypothetical protein